MARVLSRVPIFYKVIIANSAMVLIVILAFLGLRTHVIAIVTVFACGVANAILVRAALSPAAQLRELLALTFHQNEEQRAHIASRIQDNAAQRLAALVLRAPGDSVVSDEAAAVMEELCMAARTLQPPAMKLLGLKGALEWLARDIEDRAGSHVRVSCDVAPGRLAYPIALGLYRILEDILETSARNAPHHMDLYVTTAGARVDCVARVEHRFSNAEQFRIAERAAYLAGRSTVEQLDHRTVVRVTIPIQKNGSDVRYDSRIAG